MLVSGDRIEFPVIHDSRGSLSFIENERHIPFAVERVYYLYQMPEGAERGGHAHYDLEQVMIALNGSFELVLDDGKQRNVYKLDSASQGVYVGNMVWREMVNFSKGCVCLVLASKKYDEADYIRSYETFLEECNKKMHE